MSIISHRSRSKYHVGHEKAFILIYQDELVEEKLLFYVNQLEFAFPGSDPLDHVTTGPELETLQPGDLPRIIETP